MVKIIYKILLYFFATLSLSSIIYINNTVIDVYVLFIYKLLIAIPIVIYAFLNIKYSIKKETDKYFKVTENLGIPTLICVGIIYLTSFLYPLECIENSLLDTLNTEYKLRVKNSDREYFFNVFESQAKKEDFLFCKTFWGAFLVYRDVLSGKKEVSNSSSDIINKEPTIEYYGNGNTKYKAFFDGDGFMDSVFVEFYANGNIKEKSIYKSGVRVDSSIYYNEDGSIKEIKRWND